MCIRGTRGARGRGVTYTVLVTVLAVHFWGIGEPARAAYSFTKIADSNDGYSINTTTRLSINTSSVVSFKALGPGTGGGGGIYAGNGGPVATIVNDTGSFSTFSTLAPINDGGKVAFVGGLDAGGSGVYVASGGTISPIALSSSGYDFRGSPAINSAGSVAFRANRAGAGAVYVGDGGAVSTVIDSSGPLAMWPTFGQIPATPISMNSGGVVSFWGLLDNGHEGVFRAVGGSLTTLAEAPGNVNSFSSASIPWINTGGVVTFFAALVPSGSGVVTVTGNGPVTPFVTDLPGFPYSGFSDPVINSGGTIAFYGTLKSGQPGIFTGPNAVSDRVVQVGDPLFGATITEIGLFPSLNDSGAIAFTYSLNNGAHGVAVASVVPEPASVALLVVFALMGCSRRRGLRPA